MYIGESILTLTYLMTCYGFVRASGTWAAIFIAGFWPVITIVIQIGVLIRCCFDRKFCDKIYKKKEKR